jgi:hypothetical protein
VADRLTGGCAALFCVRAVSAVPVVVLLLLLGVLKDGCERYSVMRSGCVRRVHPIRGLSTPPLNPTNQPTTIDRPHQTKDTHTDPALLQGSLLADREARLSHTRRLGVGAGPLRPPNNHAEPASDDALVALSAATERRPD